MSRAFTKERDDVPEPAVDVKRRTVHGEVPAPPQDRTRAGFGATVVVEGVTAEPRTFTIVGPDETDVAAGRIGIDSPLAQALLDRRAGARVVWHRPAGDRPVKLVSVTYG